MPATAAGTTLDHIEALSKYSQYEVFTLEAGQKNNGGLPDTIDLNRFDALIIHFSMVISHDSYLSPETRKKIRDYNGLKAIFIQDDYRWINDTVNALDYLEAHILFPLTESGIMNQIYDPIRLPKLEKQTVLTGYVPENLLNKETHDFADRVIDVGYRARKLPAWIGSHALQKWQIAEKFIADAKKTKLKLDISLDEKDRIYQTDWVNFISSCKATLGTESGASLCDFTGDIQRKVEEHERKYPGTDFNTQKNLYFPNDDCKIMMNVISPRVFEAAALKTLMIMYDGYYSGVLEAGIHYVSLEKDHSNFNEVLETLENPKKATEIIQNAHREIALNEKYSFKGMVSLVDKKITKRWSTEEHALASNPMTKDEFEQLLQQEAEPALKITEEVNQTGKVARVLQLEEYNKFSESEDLEQHNSLKLYLLPHRLWQMYRRPRKHPRLLLVNSKSNSKPYVFLRKIWRFIPSGLRLMLANSVVNPALNAQGTERADNSSAAEDYTPLEDSDVKIIKSVLIALLAATIALLLFI